MMRLILAIILLSIAQGADARPKRLNVTFNPNPADIDCYAPPGTLVSHIVSSGGAGQRITYSLSGDTIDFELSHQTAPADIIVGQNGINAANCGTTRDVYVTAVQ